MKREIKFRGKRINSKQWIDGSLILNPENQYPVIGDVFSEYDDGRKVDNWIEKEVDPETIGQFTGKKDKNGKEIYEGDVCKCRYYKHAEKDLYLTQKVVFEHASFFVVVGDLKPDLETETYTNCPLNWVNEIEIIGNIYENPELLQDVI